MFTNKYIKISPDNGHRYVPLEILEIREKAVRIKNQLGLHCWVPRKALFDHGDNKHYILKGWFKKSWSKNAQAVLFSYREDCPPRYGEKK